MDLDLDSRFSCPSILSANSDLYHKAQLRLGSFIPEGLTTEMLGGEKLASRERCRKSRAMMKVCSK